MSIEFRLKFFIILIFAASALAGLVLRDWFVEFAKGGALDFFRAVFLTISLSVMISIIVSFTVKSVFTLPFERFRKRISETWKSHEVRLPDFKEESVELRLLKHSFDTVLADLEKTTKALQESTNLKAAKYQFLSTISHQLRTPITGLVWSLQMAVKGTGEKTSEGRELIKGSLEAAKRVGFLLEEMLKAAREDSESSAEIRTLIDLGQLVSEVIADAKLLAKSKDIEIVGKSIPHVPVIRGNFFAVRSVLNNLLSNAIQYSMPHGKVLVSLEEKKGGVEIAIADQGIGITSAEQARLFERFHRGGRAITQNPDGSGLGLYLARDIIEKHGGRIAVKSEADKGSLFTVWFPVQAPGQLENFIKS